MAEEILETVRTAVEGTIDFDGQRRVEVFGTLLLAITGVLAFNVGYLTSDIVKVMWVGLAGTAVTFLATIPPWPFYNTKPVKWLPAGSGLSTG